MIQSPSFISGLASASLFGVLTQVVGLGSGIATARALGPTGRGELAAVFAYFGITVWIGMFGIDQAVAYERARRREAEGGILVASIALSLALAILQMCLLLAIVPLLLASDEANLFSSVLYVTPALVPFFVCQALLGFEQGGLRFGRRGILLLIPGGFYFMCCLGLWCLNIATVPSFVLAYTFAQFMGLLAGLLLCWRSLAVHASLGREILTLLRRGVKLQLPQLGWLAAIKLDMLVVIYCLPSADVGFYAVAAAFALAQKTLIEGLGLVSFAQLSAIADRRHALLMLVTHFRTALGLSFLIFLLLLSTCPWTIHVLYGREFAPAIKVAPFLLLSWFFLGLASCLDRGLRALGRTSPGILGFGAGATVLAVAGLYFVPVLGLRGMAWVSLASSLVSFGVLGWSFVVGEKIGARRLFLSKVGKDFGSFERSRGSVRRHSVARYVNHSTAHSAVESAPHLQSCDGTASADGERI